MLGDHVQYFSFILILECKATFLHEHMWLIGRSATEYSWYTQDFLFYIPTVGWSKWKSVGHAQCITYCLASYFQNCSRIPLVLKLHFFFAYGMSWRLITLHCTSFNAKGNNLNHCCLSDMYWKGNLGQNQEDRLCFSSTVYHDICNHIKRAQYVARIWMRTDRTDATGEASSTDYGWKLTWNC